MIEDKFYYSDLFEVYGDILTDKQIEIMTMFLNYDLGVSEIAENLKVSRQSVFDTIRKSKEKLVFFESKVKYVKVANDVNSKLSELIDNFDDYDRSELHKRLISIRMDR
ncbi:MAG: hypothetical protein CSB15_00960 [Clostridiales bacterium]|nr:MAG: hypothetical protein CSB15_00960 [Clostridiales bacterium]